MKEMAIAGLVIAIGISWFFKTDFVTTLLWTEGVVLGIKVLTWLLNGLLFVLGFFAKEQPADALREQMGRGHFNVEDPNPKRPEDFQGGTVQEIFLPQPVLVAIEYAYQRGDGRLPENRIVRFTRLEGRMLRQGLLVPTYLDGFCELRQAERTFKYRRIQKAWNPVTGEAIENLGHYLLMQGVPGLQATE